MKILFGTGYSKFAAQYFQYIQWIANQIGASITLVHVYDRPLLLSELGEDFDDIPYSDQIRLRDEAVLKLEEARIKAFVEDNRNLEHPGLGIETIVECTVYYSIRYRRGAVIEILAELVQATGGKCFCSPCCCGGKELRWSKDQSKIFKR